MSTSTNASSLHAVARAAAAIGAVGSEAALLRAGYRGEASMPPILLVLFTGWVLSPFVAFLLTDRLASRWSELTRAALYRVMLLVTLVSLVSYGIVALNPPRPRPAVVFLMVPLGSFLLVTIVLAIARSRSGTRSG